MHGRCMRHDPFESEMYISGFHSSFDSPSVVRAGTGGARDPQLGFSRCFCIGVGERAPNVTHHDVGMKRD